MRSRFLVLVVALGGLGFLSAAPPAGAQSSEHVTVDFSAVGPVPFGCCTPFARDFFNLEGLVLAEDGFVRTAEGDEALSLGTGSIEGVFDGGVTELSARVAPSLRGLESSFTRIVSEIELDALDAGGAVIGQGTVTVETNSQTGTGFGYVTIDLGPLDRPAAGFRLTGDHVASDAFCGSDCPNFFVVSEIAYTINRPEQDTVGPVLTVPTEVKANATSTEGARVSYRPRVTDNRDPDPELGCEPASGSLFAVGATSVSCTARDASGNTVDKSLEVVVRPFPGDGVDYVSGFGIYTGHDVEVLATSRPDGTDASGTGRVRGSVYNLDLEVTCLRVGDNRAVVGFSITSGSTTPGSPFGEGLLIEYVDNGDGGTADQLRYEFVQESPASCPSPSSQPGGTLAGDVDVHDEPLDSTPPTLTVPAGITANATGPTGARITYTASATDNSDPLPDVRCNPPSGSTFPIGSTTVRCTATDDAGNTATRTFNVVVKGAGAQIADLASLAGSFGLRSGIGRSFVAKLEAARDALAAGDRQQACGSLKAFLNHTKAQSGKGLSVAQANRLTTDAIRIRAVLSCSS